MSNNASLSLLILHLQVDSSITQELARKCGDGFQSTGCCCFTWMLLLFLLITAVINCQAYQQVLLEGVTCMCI